MKLGILLKVCSPFDGFRPSRLPERPDGRKALHLGSKRYLDGEYAKGRVVAVNHGRRTVQTRADKSDTEEPITDGSTSSRVAEIIAPRGRQVSPIPRNWEPTPKGFTRTLHTDGSRCAKRVCLDYPTWCHIRMIRGSELQRPERPGGAISLFAPAFWVIPARSFIYAEGKVDERVVRMSAEFYSLKYGSAGKAYPLALGIHRKLGRAKLDEVDAIVPIPLSPDKARSGETHRARLLAVELGRLLGVPVREWLRLQDPISKRRSRRLGRTEAQHRKEYRQLLWASGCQARYPDPAGG